jgi:hypothetical protein
MTSKDRRHTMSADCLSLNTPVSAADWLGKKKKRRKLVFSGF